MVLSCNFLRHLHCCCLSSQLFSYNGFSLKAENWNLAISQTAACYIIYAVWYLCVRVNALYVCLLCLCVKKAPSMLWLSRWTSLSRQNGDNAACVSVYFLECEFSYACVSRPDILWVTVLRGRHIKRWRRARTMKTTKGGKKLGGNIVLEVSCH